MEATTLLPGLPQIDIRVLEAAKMGVFQNILFGGLGSDMVEMMMVRRFAGARALCMSVCAHAATVAHEISPWSLPRNGVCWCRP